MNSKKELAAQNFQDCFSILYLHLAETILRERGKDGEAVVRKACHLCGVRMGTAKRESHKEKGLLTNLKTCFSMPSACHSDPRFAVRWQLFGEEEAVFDVDACPIYAKLEEAGKKELSLPFCEEYHHGFLMGYTKGKSQCCLSEHFVFPGETSCRLGCYFRAANLDEKERPLCFDRSRGEQSPPPRKFSACEEPKAEFSLWAGLLVSSFLEECSNRYGEQSIYIVAAGLQAAAAETALFLLTRGSATGHRPDGSFLSANAFWDCPEALPQPFSQREKELLSLNYCRILRKEFGL